MEIVKMGNETDTMPDMDFLARYLPGGLDIIKIMRQGSDFYKAWDCRTLALDSSAYFKMCVQELYWILPRLFTDMCLDT